MRRLLWVLAVLVPVSAQAQSGLIQLSDGTIGVKTVVYDPNGSEATPLSPSDLAQDATVDQPAISTGPQVHCYASDATPTAVTADADAVRVWCDLNGRVITSPYSSNANWTSGRSAVTDGASTAVVAAQGAGVSFCATTLIVSNSSATGVTVDIRDGTAGTVLATVPAAADFGGAIIPLPVPLCTSANTALAQDPSAAATTVTVTAIGFKAAL